MNTRNLAIVIIILAAISVVAIYSFLPKGTNIKMTVDKSQY